MDFLGGASRSQALNCRSRRFPRRQEQGKISRIVPMLDLLAQESVTSRGLVRYVVTEYGKSQFLHGKTIRERAKSLIEIAHPDFRASLYEYCEKTKWAQVPHPARTAASR